MVPQVSSHPTDPEEHVLPTSPPVTASATEEEGTAPATPAAADAKQEAPETAWAAIIVLGTTVLLMCTGLGVAVALHIDFAAWLFGGILGMLVIVSAINIVDREMLQTLSFEELQAARRQ